MKVFLKGGTAFNFLEFESLSDVERSLDNNGYKITSSKESEFVRRYERPSSNYNKRSTFCIYLYNDKALVFPHG